MNKLKGIAQLNNLENSDAHRVYTYVECSGEENLRVILEDGLNYTHWHKDQIAGTGNENFTKFHLWFEYE